ncbi:MAG: gluconate 2-dehydrogenase subunit 3 family protein [Bacteroidetes bacterium]|nr:MAG: gluconate 2-dehydrogenase subunit 3 family protein [Bacteroidota bacterium]
MNRRDALKRTSLLLGGAASMPLLASWLSGCRADPGWQPATLTAEQNDLAAALAEAILPETDTPGARAAEVNRFIDVLVTEVLPPRTRQAMLDGLDDVDARAREAYGEAFAALAAEQQAAILDALVADARAAAPAGRTFDLLSAPNGPDVPPPFFELFKAATLLGYYTSEIGATQELRYVAVPGRYDADVPFPSETVDRTWAV